MDNRKLAVVLLGCVALPAYAQSTVAPVQASPVMCDAANLDRSRNVFTIANPLPGINNQQCFLHVVPRDQTLGPGQLAEGDYTIVLSGGGGGGGGGIDGGNPGRPGANATPERVTQHLAPGMYRLTLGTGGMGGAGCRNATGGEDGAPTSLANAHTGAMIAGFPRAEYWVRIYHSDNVLASARPRPMTLARVDPTAAAGPGAPAAPASTDLVARGGAGGAGGGSCSAGAQGEHGFISLQPAS